MRAIEPLSADAWTSDATKTYLAAFAKLEANDPGAVAAFASHLGAHPDDQLASYHLKRLLNGATGTRIAME
jgi:adenylate cyclase